MSFFFPIVAIGIIGYVLFYGTAKHVTPPDDPEDRPEVLGGKSEEKERDTSFQKHISEPPLIPALQPDMIPISDMSSGVTNF